jgi:hypothetical protein
MHGLKEVKKCGKDICGSELYTLVVSFCSKKQYFFKNNYKIGLLKQNPRYTRQSISGYCDFAVTRNERQDGAILG